MAKSAKNRKRTTHRRAAGNNAASNNKEHGHATQGVRVKTDDKGRIWNHIRQKWLVETPEERFAYPVFLYDAEHVGITATGEQDTCGLYHSTTLGLPTGILPQDTALEQYRRFGQSPESFMLSEATP